MSMLFRANCQTPQMVLSTHEILFVSNHLSSSAESCDVTVVPSAMELWVQNQLDTDLTYAVRNDSQFFTAQLDEDSTICGAQQKQKVVIKPRMKRLMRKLDFTLKVGVLCYPHV